MPGAGELELELGDQSAGSFYLLGESLMLLRVEMTEPRANHGQGAATSGKRPAVGGAVDAEGQAADDNHPSASELRPELVGRVSTLGRTPARTDDGHGNSVGFLQISPGPKGARSVLELHQVARVKGVVDDDTLEPLEGR